MLGDDQIAQLSYRPVGGRIELQDTSVLPAYRDHGVAAALIAEALDDIRQRGKTVTVTCPVTRWLIDHYPQYEDLVDREHPGVRLRYPA